jgi:nucleotide-binding universal stress UspA family protein
MTLPTTILVPIDFSSEAELALDHAVMLATNLDARIHLVHAIAAPTLGIAEVGATLGIIDVDDYVTRAEEALERLGRRQAGRVGRTMVRVGDPREMILAACAEIGADLIVMGAHGRRRLSHALLGSVAESVVRNAQCPVLVVRFPNAN